MNPRLNQSLQNESTEMRLDALALSAEVSRADVTGANDSTLELQKPLRSVDVLALAMKDSAAGC